MPADPDDVTRLLVAHGEGDRDALHRLMPLVYEELHRLAHRHRLGERAGHTLGTTGLVHEAYLKLVRLDRIQWQNRAQFFALAAQAMRRVLVDHAVRRKALKRGGGVAPQELEESFLSDQQADDVLHLDEALRNLEALDERQFRVVECRFFGGLTIEETADVLGTSTATVKRDWNVARAWLNLALTSE